MVNGLIKPIKVPRPIIVTSPLESIKQQAAALVEEEKEQEQQSLGLCYVGSDNYPITNELKIVLPEDDVPRGTWPVFRMMDESGKFRSSAPVASNNADATSSTTSNLSLPEMYSLSQLQSLLIDQHPHYAPLFESSTLLRPSTIEFPDTPGSTNTLLRAHRQMIRLRKMDTILHNAQRQGRISFYMTQHGEEAIHMGSASALHTQDVILAQYREAGLLMWRGFTLDQFCNQCFSNDLDAGKGRQMPVHYGCRELNYQTVSSPLGTQITQAVGAAYKFKLDALSLMDKKPIISIVYFGEGAASTIDFHSGCNFAATLRTPMIFFCRNNGYAISTPVKDQYAGDGIISRAPGYGMAGIRVDGNDIFAVHAAVTEARKLALQTSGPVMIEAMTYRSGHHSTSDDSSRYRPNEEVQKATDVSDPLVRFDRFLTRIGWLDVNAKASIEDEERVAVLRAMEGAERRPKPRLDTMFVDVYHKKPPHLVRQEQELLNHLKRHNIS